MNRLGVSSLKGTLENKPGCNAEQTLEALVNGELGRIRDLVGGAEEEILVIRPVTLDRHRFGPFFQIKDFFQGFPCIPYILTRNYWRMAWMFRVSFNF